MFVHYYSYFYCRGILFCFGKVESSALVLECCPWYFLNNRGAAPVQNRFIELYTHYTTHPKSFSNPKLMNHPPGFH